MIPLKEVHVFSIGICVSKVPWCLSAMAASGSMHTGTRLLIVALGFSCLAPVPANIGSGAPPHVGG